MKLVFKILGLALCLVVVFGCAPKTGSPEWCEMMKKKDKGDWTLNQGKDFVKYCLIEKNKTDE